MITKPLCSRLCLTALVPWLWVASGSAGEEPSPHEVIEDRLDLVAMELELTITDRQGKPVRDLERDDLELFHDGIRQEILSFESPAVERPAVRRPAAGPAPNVRPRHVVVYVDNLRARASRRNRMLRRVEGFLVDRIARGDRVSVVGFDGAVHWLARASSDAAAVRAGLAALAEWPSGSRRTQIEARRIQQALADGVATSLIEPQIADHVARVAVAAARSLSGLTRAASGLPRLAIPTAWLVVGDGIPARPGEEWLGAGSNPDSRSYRVVRRALVARGRSETDSAPTPAVQYLVSRPRSLNRSGADVSVVGVAPLLDPLVAVAHAHRVSFYPVRPPAPASSSLAGSSSRSDQLTILRQMAELTGGDLVPHGKLAAALAELSERWDSTYTLGFQLAPGTDHGPRSLEVKLGRKGLEAHYRRGLGPAEPGGDGL